MQEIEMKLRIRDETQLRSKLKQLGGVHLINLHHTDRYYDKYEPEKSFELTDEALRLRQSLEYLIDTNELTNTHNDLTYKGAKLPGVIKSRKELICEILHPDQMDGILVSLGFIMRCKLEKHREVWAITFQRTNIEILIDVVEGLPGLFMEAEIMVERGQEFARQRATQTLLALLSELGYTEEDSIRESYLELYLAQQTT